MSPKPSGVTEVAVSGDKERMAFLDGTRETRGLPGTRRIPKGQSWAGRLGCKPWLWGKEMVAEAIMVRTSPEGWPRRDDNLP